MPILFISAPAGEVDQVRALENGGDDYITKPFHLELVLAKARSAYGEYTSARESDLLQVGSLLLNRSENRMSPAVRRWSSSSSPS